MQKLLLSCGMQWLAPPESKLFTAEDEVLRLHAFLLLLEAPVLQLLVNKAFPPQELRASDGRLGAELLA